MVSGLGLVHLPKLARVASAPGAYPSFAAKVPAVALENHCRGPAVVGEEGEQTGRPHWPRRVSLAEL